MSSTGDYISREATLNALRKAHDPNTARMAISFAAVNSVPAANVRPVVTCSDCKWWTKQESSLQGHCELLQMYPTGAWFCANGKREES